MVGEATYIVPWLVINTDGSPHMVIRYQRTGKRRSSESTQVHGIFIEQSLECLVNYDHNACPPTTFTHMIHRHSWGLLIGRSWYLVKLPVGTAGPEGDSPALGCTCVVGNTAEARMPPYPLPPVSTVTHRQRDRNGPKKWRLGPHDETGEKCDASVEVMMYTPQTCQLRLHVRVH